ncbi:hypothetical protein [Chryseobacterium gleum]|uniref:hypothetical protein n=1 Tax=Chryseobacterium gleum TaxID=250 RepID=UPI001E42CFC5|nr:hypothetical protein [Chryseobacterium gleum]MCD9615360.1 hypothetical protein [Chryseobacterium gleum]MCE4066263.1 hypothetical protein [Chryseobacterium gleum]
MKKLLLPLVLLTSLNVYSQVGMNTTSPSATVDIVSKGNTNATKALEINDSTNKELLSVSDDGSVRLENYKNFSLLGTDANGNLVNGTTASIPSIVGIATGIASTSDLPANTEAKYNFTVNKINSVNLSYSSGNFTVLKAGYYGISLYTKKDVSMNSPATGGTVQTFIKKTVGATTTELSVNQNGLTDNVSFEANTIGVTAYFNIGDIISCRANYTRPHRLTTASLSIVYYGT